MKCPKCGWQRQPHETAPEWQCPSCQVAYAKVMPVPEAVARMRQQAISDKAAHQGAEEDVQLLHLQHGRARHTRGRRGPMLFGLSLVFLGLILMKGVLFDPWMAIRAMDPDVRFYGFKGILAMVFLLSAGLCIMAHELWADFEFDPRMDQGKIAVGVLGSVCCSLFVYWAATSVLKSHGYDTRSAIAERERAQRPVEWQPDGAVTLSYRGDRLIVVDSLKHMEVVVWDQVDRVAITSRTVGEYEGRKLPSFVYWHFSLRNGDSVLVPRDDAGEDMISWLEERGVKLMSNESQSAAAAGDMEYALIVYERRD